MTRKEAEKMTGLLKKIETIIHKNYYPHIRGHDLSVPCARAVVKVFEDSLPNKDTMNLKEGWNRCLDEIKKGLR